MSTKLRLKDKSSNVEDKEKVNNKKDSDLLFHHDHDENMENNVLLGNRNGNEDIDFSLSFMKPRPKSGIRCISSLEALRKRNSMLNRLNSQPANDNNNPSSNYDIMNNYPPQTNMPFTDTTNKNSQQHQQQMLLSRPTIKSHHIRTMTGGNATTLTTTGTSPPHPPTLCIKASSNEQQAIIKKNKMRREINIATNQQVWKFNDTKYNEMFNKYLDKTNNTIQKQKRYRQSNQFPRRPSSSFISFGVRKCHYTYSNNNSKENPNYIKEIHGNNRGERSKSTPLVKKNQIDFLQQNNKNNNDNDNDASPRSKEIIVVVADKNNPNHNTTESALSAIKNDIAWDITAAQLSKYFYFLF